METANWILMITLQAWSRKKDLPLPTLMVLYLMEIGRGARDMGSVFSGGQMEPNMKVKLN